MNHKQELRDWIEEKVQSELFEKYSLSSIITQNQINFEVLKGFYNDLRDAISETKEDINKISASTKGIPKQAKHEAGVIVSSISSDKVPRYLGRDTEAIGKRDVKIVAMKTWEHLLSIMSNALYKNFAEGKKAEAVLRDLESGFKSFKLKLKSENEKHKSQTGEALVIGL